jgi:hypothetical protein
MVSHLLRRSGCLVSTGCTVLLLLSSACGSPTAPRPPNEPVDPPIVTDRPAYTLTPENNGLSVTISYVFTNRTGGPVYVVNCRGGFARTLQRWNGVAWVDAWAPGVLDCLSDPIVINAEESFATQLHVWGARPGSDWLPQFDVTDPSGWYRLVWIDALSSFNRSASPFGAQIPLEMRVSNSFELRR